MDLQRFHRQLSSVRVEDGPRLPVAAATTRPNRYAGRYRRGVQQARCCLQKSHAPSGEILQDVMTYSRIVSFVFSVLLLLAGCGLARGQAVAVTSQLDSNRITVGSSTTLRIYAQVVPLYRTSADRIFS